MKPGIECTPKQQRLLEQIKDCARNGLSSYCRTLLEVGKLCDELILDRLKDGYRGDTTRAMITDYLGHTFGKEIRVGRIVGTWHISRIFGDPGTASHSAIREFYPLVKRDTKTETWAARPEHFDKAKKLYRQAVTERWNKEVVADSIFALLGKRRRSTARKDRMLAPRTQDSLIQAAKLADPKDVADFILHLIMASEKAEKIVAILKEDERFSVTQIIPKRTNGFRTTNGIHFAHLPAVGT